MSNNLLTSTNSGLNHSTPPPFSLFLSIFLLSLSLAFLCILSLFFSHPPPSPSYPPLLSLCILVFLFSLNLHLLTLVPCSFLIPSLSHGFLPEKMASFHPITPLSPLPHPNTPTPHPSIHPLSMMLRHELSFLCDIQLDSMQSEAAADELLRARENPTTTQPPPLLPASLSVPNIRGV